MSDAFTLLDEDRSIETRADVADGAVCLSPDAVRDALGWTLKPEGLCRGEACVPIGDLADRINADGIDPNRLLQILGNYLPL